MKTARVPGFLHGIVLIVLVSSLETGARPLYAPPVLGATVSYELHQDTLPTSAYHVVFGPIPFTNAPTNSVVIPLAGSYTAATPFAAPVVPLTVKYTYRVWLDSAQNLDVTLTNKSSAVFSAVQITIGTLGTATIGTLDTASTGTARLSAGGKEIDSIMTVTLTATPAASGTFGLGDNLNLAFSLNGLLATKVVVLDSLLKNYSRTFTNEYNLAETLNIDYIDIAQGFFIYAATNLTSLNLILSARSRHLWRTDFCMGTKPPLTSVNGLAGLSFSDSVSNFDGDIAVRENFPAGQTNQYSKHNISANRLFPEWNPAQKKSITKVDFDVAVGTYGRRVTLSAIDSLLFTISTASFKYRLLSGTVTEALRRSSDTLKEAVPPSWYSSPDSNNLSRAVFLSVTVPDSCFIETLTVAHDFFSPAAVDSTCSTTLRFTHAVDHSSVTGRCDFARIIASKPDSIWFTEGITIPAGTRVRLVNDLTDPADPEYAKYIGRTKIRDSLAVSLSPDAIKNPRSRVGANESPDRFECIGSSRTVRYALPVPCRVSATYYDTRGRLIYSIVNKTQGPGRFVITLPGFSCAQGPLFLVFQAGSFVKKEKVIMLR